jgi:hypothetical protein
MYPNADTASLANYYLASQKIERDWEELTAQKDSAYAERDKCLVLLALMAQRLGLKVGMGLHVDKPGEEWDADWRNILFIDLPAGQVSWHIHESETSWFYFVGAYDSEWDQHTTDEKYRRVLEPGL